MLESIIENLPYLGLAAVLFLSGFGVPIPEDIPLIIGGYICGKGDADIYLMLPLAMFTILGTDYIIYLLGRRLGHTVPKIPIFRRYLSEARLARAAEAFHKHGGKVIFFVRFLPGLRAPVYFTAGTFKIPHWKMLLFDGSAALISVPVFMLLPYFFVDRIDQVRKYIGQGQVILLVVIVLGIIGYLIYLCKRNQKNTANDSAAGSTQSGG